MDKASAIVEQPASATTGVPAQASRAAQPGSYRPGYERVADQILDLIGQLRLQPGERIPTEHELAAQLGASRTMVREAIRILSALGRVRAQKGRGLYESLGFEGTNEMRLEGGRRPTSRRAS